MPNLLTRKLELFAPLPEGDKRLLDDVVDRTRMLGSRESIIQEGDPPFDVHLVLSGLACRSKSLLDGERQIVAFMVPGDLCSFSSFILNRTDHTLSTIGPCTVAYVPRGRILEMLQRPHLVRALWWSSLVDEAVLREWLTNLGQRDAQHRMAHLFCELHLRMDVVGLADNGAFDLPLTQADLAEALGLSTVHVNRSLQSLRADGLIQFRSGRLTIPDVDRLRKTSGFDPTYLHHDARQHD